MKNKKVRIILLMTIVGILFGFGAWYFNIRSSIIGTWEVTYKDVVGQEYVQTFTITNKKITNKLVRSDGSINEFDLGSYSVIFNKIRYNCDKNRTEGSTCLVMEYKSKTLKIEDRIYTKK